MRKLLFGLALLASISSFASTQDAEMNGKIIKETVCTVQVHKRPLFHFFPKTVYEISLIAKNQSLNLEYDLEKTTLWSEKNVAATADEIYELGRKHLLNGNCGSLEEDYKNIESTLGSKKVRASPMPY